MLKSRRLGRGMKRSEVTAEMGAFAGYEKNPALITIIFQNSIIT
jgi:hypothetical protein